MRCNILSEVAVERRSGEIIHSFKITVSHLGLQWYLGIGAGKGLAIMVPGTKLLLNCFVTKSASTHPSFNSHGRIGITCLNPKGETQVQFPIMLDFSFAFMKHVVDFYNDSL